MERIEIRCNEIMVNFNYHIDERIFRCTEFDYVSNFLDNRLTTIHIEKVKEMNTKQNRIL